MREAFCAVWDGVNWCPKTNDPVLGQYDLVAAEWPVHPLQVLPTPRFGVGARIKFKWDRGYLHGTITEVRAYFDILPGIVVYEIREIGHRRTVYDNGRADITVE
jgi:hypothetical protein